MMPHLSRSSNSRVSSTRRRSRSSAPRRAAGHNRPLVVLVDDESGIPNALRHYPPGHGLRIVDTTDALHRSTVRRPVERRPLRRSSPHPRSDRTVGCPRRLPTASAASWIGCATPSTAAPGTRADPRIIATASTRRDLRSAGSDRLGRPRRALRRTRRPDDAGRPPRQAGRAGWRVHARRRLRKHPSQTGPPAPRTSSATGTANTPKLVEGAWERLKARERPNRESVLDGVPRTLPALARAQSIWAVPNATASPGKPKTQSTWVNKSSASCSKPEAMRCPARMPSATRWEHSSAVSGSRKRGSAPMPRRGSGSPSKPTGA